MSEFKDFECYLVAESGKAFLFRLPDGREQWFPKSQVRDVDSKDKEGLQIIKVKSWLLEKMGEAGSSEKAVSIKSDVNDEKQVADKIKIDKLVSHFWRTVEYMKELEKINGNYASKIIEDNYGVLEKIRDMTNRLLEWME
ncbi:MAG: hypothetical protein EU529_05865 [Promethearchaeota archaeon]|nr:MAG: hypothetical protein EU529_05865 [Candidatus Lokiarchaeota archaeon]